MPSLTDVLESLGGLTGLSGLSGFSTKQRDISEAAVPLVKDALYDGLINRACADAAEKRMAEIVKAQDEHCKEHQETADRLETELQQSRDARHTEAQKVFRLSTLVSEIIAEMMNGRILTTDEISVGKRNALNQRYSNETYLPKPKPATSGDGKVDGHAATVGTGFVPNSFEQPQA